MSFGFLSSGLLLASPSLPEASALLLDAARTEQRIVAVGERSAIIYSDDSGTSWHKASAPLGPTLTGLCFARDNIHGWAVGHGGKILATTDAGTTWTLVYQSPDQDSVLLDVAALSDTHLLAVGAFGLAVESKDAGASWAQLNLPCEDRHLNQVTATQEGAVFIAGESGTLLRSLNQGDSWDVLPSPYEGSFYGAYIAPSGSLIAYGLRGHIFVSDRDATKPGIPQWSQAKNTEQGLLLTLLALKQGRLLAAGQSRVFLISDDKGASWKQWPLNENAATSALTEAPDGSLLAFGENGVIKLPAPPSTLK